MCTNSSFQREEEEEEEEENLSFVCSQSNQFEFHFNLDVLCTEHVLIQCDTLTREQLNGE